QLAEIAEQDADKYSKLWNEFGAVIKEGLHTDGGQRDELTELLRYRSVAKDDGSLSSLAAYVEAMPDDQKSIWYIAGPDEAALRNSPHLEAVRAKGQNVLLMTDPVDEWVLQSLAQYKDKPFRSVTQGELDDKTEDAQDDKDDD